MQLEELARARPNKTVRVALDTTYAGLNPTGVGLYSRRLAKSLSEKHSILRLDFRCYGAAIAGESGRKSVLAVASEWPTNTHLALPLRLLRHKPSVVHSTSHIGPLWGPGKLVVTVHDLIFRRYPEDYDRAWLAIARLTLPLVFRRATRIIADSYATKDDIEKYYGPLKNKVVVIYPGIDPSYAEHKQSSSELQSNPYVLCLGPWVKRKNLEVVLRAFSLLAEDVPELRLVITGKPSRGMRGYSPDKLLALVPDDHRQSVELVGYVAEEKLVELVAGAALLAYPSRWEGFGLPPLEAMSAGVPVIASNTPAVAEVTGGAAILCDPDNPRQWASEMRRILTDPGHRANFVEHGIKRSAFFSWDNCAEITGLLYHQVAGNIPEFGVRLSQDANEDRVP